MNSNNTIEECNKFFDTLKILVLEHPIVADWWVEIMDRYDDILKECKDDIIDAAAEKLAERLARTKRAKEVLNEH